MPFLPFFFPGHGVRSLVVNETLNRPSFVGNFHSLKRGPMRRSSRKMGANIQASEANPHKRYSTENRQQRLSIGSRRTRDV